MKKFLWVAGLLLALGASLYLAAGPHRTLRNIETAVSQGDAFALEQHIDFALLRHNLKEQLRQRLLQQPNPGSPDQAAVGVFLSGFAGWLLDASVEALVTPSGLAALMDGRQLLQAGEAESGATSAAFFEEARFSYDSHNQFSIYIPNDQGAETRLLLQRQGLEWKLVNILVAE